MKNEPKIWENLKLRNRKSGIGCVIISVKWLDKDWGSISDVDRICYLLYFTAFSHHENPEDFILLCIFVHHFLVWDLLQLPVILVAAGAASYKSNHCVSCCYTITCAALCCSCDGSQSWWESGIFTCDCCSIVLHESAWSNTGAATSCVSQMWRLHLCWFMAKVKEICCEINRSFDLLQPELFVGCVNIVHNIRNINLMFMGPRIVNVLF